MAEIVATNVVASRPPERRPTATPTARANTSLAAPGALAHRLQRRTARKANEANLDPPNKKSEITSV